MSKTKFYSIDAVLFGNEDQQDGNNKSVLLVDHALPLLEEGYIDTLPQSLRKRSKRLRSQYLRRRKQEIIDLIETMSNPQAQLAVRAELEKQVYKQVIELRNRWLAEKPVGETYFNLSLRRASRKDKIRLLRSVWSKQAWKKQKTKRQTQVSFDAWWYNRNKLASRRRKC